MRRERRSVQSSQQRNVRLGTQGVPTIFTGSGNPRWSRSSAVSVGHRWSPHRSGPSTMSLPSDSRTISTTESHGSSRLRSRTGRTGQEGLGVLLRPGHNGTEGPKSLVENPIDSGGRGRDVLYPSTPEGEKLGRTSTKIKTKNLRTNRGRIRTSPGHPPFLSPSPAPIRLSLPVFLGTPRRRDGRPPPHTLLITNPTCTS